MSKGGAQLLANITFKTDDPQTLRMVAGALANLCGNGKNWMVCFLIFFSISPLILFNTRRILNSNISIVS